MAALLEAPGALTLTVTVNGEARRVAHRLTLAALVEHLGFEARKVAVERNLAIVPRSRLGETLLAEGDRIEIVHFVGGG